MAIRKTPAERKIADIKEAKDLLSLVKALRHATAFFSERGERLSDYIDLSSLPKFGTGPKNTLGVFSWDGDLHVLIPSEEPKMNGWEVVKVDNL
jgi:hypothetical protein